MADNYRKNVNWFGLPLKRIEFKVTETEMATLFSVGKTVIPASPKYYAIPVWWHIDRAPGTAYTGATALTLTNGTTIFMHTFNTPLGTGPVTYFVIGPTNSGTGVGGCVYSASAAPGMTAISLKALTAEPTGGTGGLACQLAFINVPLGRLIGS